SFSANGACASPDAQVDGSGMPIRAHAGVGPEVSIGSNAVMGVGAQIVGRVCRRATPDAGARVVNGACLGPSTEGVQVATRRWLPVRV
ncbi:MAG: UDP-3-O-[3-hydroxymyristoyl] glucosamine N-acyltransferase, partial [Myxococcota bacterium]